jgi:hypothetical protein
MARLTTPNRGQPLDVDYIANIVGEVNKLTDIVGNTSTAYSNINDVNVKTNNIKFFAKSINIVKASTASTGGFVDQDVIYPAFNGFPIVVATISNGASGTSGTLGDRATVVIRSITSTVAKVRVTFYSSGTLNVNLNVIAIGLNQQ